MGKNAKIKSRRNRFKKGDLIQLVRPAGFLPAGLYIYEGKMGNLAQLSAGDVFAGIDQAFLEDCTLLTGGKKPTLRIPTEKEIEDHQKNWLEIHRTENTTQDGDFEITQVLLTPEDTRKLGLPERLYYERSRKVIN